MPRLRMTNWVKEQERFNRWLASKMAYHKENQTTMSKEIGISQCTFSQKVNNLLPWKLEEIIKMCLFLHESYTIGEEHD